MEDNSLSLINLIFSAGLVVQVVMIVLVLMSIYSWTVIMSKKKVLMDATTDIKNKGIINKKISQAALKTLKVDEAGLEQLDRDYLNLVINKFSAGPVGLDTLSTALGEERLTLEDMVEPYLLQQGFIMRTPRGRVATDLAFSHLGVVRHNHTKDLYGK